MRMYPHLAFSRASRSIRLRVSAASGGRADPPTARYPLSQEQRTVPTQKRLRAYREAGPAIAREQPARRSEQGSVDGRVLRPLPATPEDRELVAQHEDLELSLAAAADEQAKNAAEEPVQQRQQHDPQSEPTRPRPPAAPS
jgi:hypothetical protein